ncbi:MAG: hypothetical protein A3G75_15665 [Verrucomicrobia bacterium RIFCSPLOWO2_12_FULL_64_8]|nr:MAG: hypothetical protein A3G75_15665 [Verrucomicrobia bacterium RIFCSPLOWO2_12_FULL_64_8]
MADSLFYAFATLTALAATAVVVNRNVVNAAMSLLLSFMGIAALFCLLDAGLLAAVFVLVYAGAVVVLFLFVIMLLDIRGGDPHKPYKKVTAAAWMIAVALVTSGLLSLDRHGQLPETAPVGAFGFKEFGYQLFTTYLLPVQVTGFLLLIAMLGVVVLSKKTGTREETK